MRVRETTTLLYYDGPRIVLAADERGISYIADLVSEDHEEDQYQVVPVDSDQLFSYLTGKIDLRDLLLTAGDSEWFLAEPLPTPVLEMILAPQAIPIREAGMLPRPGLNLRCSPEQALEIVREAGMPAPRLLTPAPGARSGAAAG